MQSNHGSIEQCFKSQILTLELTGSINRQTLQSALELTKQLATDDIIAQPWGICVDMAHYQGHTPEAEVGTDVFRQWCLENNQRCEAFAYADNLLFKSIVENYLRSREVQIPYAFFQRSSEAKNWLNQQLRGITKLTN